MKLRDLINLILIVTISLLKLFELVPMDISWVTIFLFAVIMFGRYDDWYDLVAQAIWADDKAKEHDRAIERIEERLDKGAN